MFYGNYAIPLLLLTILCSVDKDFELKSWVLFFRNNIFGMGVADGVYAWKEAGIDSGAMSRALMETAMHMVKAGYEDVFKSRYRHQELRLEFAVSSV